MCMQPVSSSASAISSATLAGRRVLDVDGARIFLLALARLPAVRGSHDSIQALLKRIIAVALRSVNVTVSARPGRRRIDGGGAWRYKPNGNLVGSSGVVARR